MLEKDNLSAGFLIILLKNYILNFTAWILNLPLVIPEMPKRWMFPSMLNSKNKDGFCFIFWLLF